MGVPSLVLLLSPWAYPSHANCLMQGRSPPPPLYYMICVLTSLLYIYIYVYIFATIDLYKTWSIAMHFGKEYQNLGLEKGQGKSGILSWQKSGNPALLIVNTVFLLHFY